MIPLVQLILALGGSLLAPQILRTLGLLPPPANDSSTIGNVMVMADHPAARALASSVGTAPSTGTTPATGTAPSTGTTPATGTTQAAPPVKQIVADSVRNPWALFGIALVLFAAPLTISQVRAAGHDIAGGTRSVYEESRAGVRRIDNADDYTDIERHQRRRKGRK